MIDIVGWIGTLLVLGGYLLNANKFHVQACALWIVGDIAWITYDTIRGIYPHLVLSLVIISINVYAMINLSRKCKLN